MSERGQTAASATGELERSPTAHEAAAAAAAAREDAAAAIARADETIARASAAGRATTQAAMAAAATVPVPAAALDEAASTKRRRGGAEASDRAAGEPRPAAHLGGPPRAAPSGEAASPASVTTFASFLRSIPGIERFGRLRLAELERAGPTALKQRWQGMRGDLEQEYGQLTVAEVLDRFAGPGSGGAGRGA
jgi:hypothetical protein